MQGAETNRSVKCPRALALIAGVGLLALTTFSAPAADEFAPSSSSPPAVILVADSEIPDQPGPGPTDQEAETAEMEGETGQPTPGGGDGSSPRLNSLTANEKVADEEAAQGRAPDEATREPATVNQAASPGHPVTATNAPQTRTTNGKLPVTVRPTVPVAKPLYEPSRPESTTRLDVVVQGIISAAAVLLVLVAASVYTGTLRKRLSQQNEFIQKRGEALAAVEARLRDSFAATRAELEARIEEQQAELAQLQRTLESETQARVRAENALSGITLHDNSIAGCTDNTPCRSSQAREEGPECRTEPSLEPVGDDIGCSTISPALTDWPTPLLYDLSDMQPAATPAKLARKRNTAKASTAKKPLANRARRLR